MRLHELLRELRTVLHDSSGAELLEVIKDQNTDGPWWAFGRDPRGQHCLYLALPLTAEQITTLRTADVLVSEPAYSRARKELLPQEPLN